MARPVSRAASPYPSPVIVPNRATAATASALFNDEARVIRAIASVSLSVAYSLGHQRREGYRANAELQSKLFYSTNCGPDTRVEFCAKPPEILAYAAPVFRQMG